MVYELRFIEGGNLVETWNRTDFIPQIDTLVALKDGTRYKVKALLIHKPPEDYLRLLHSAIVEVTVTKEEEVV